MISDLNQFDKFFKKGRIYKFYANQGGNGVLCEDIGVAAALMCHAIKYVDRKVQKDYKPGKFAGTAGGFIKQSGEKIFLFDIRGDVKELSERRMLFHASLHRSDRSEFKYNMNFLLEELEVAKRVDESGSKSYAMKGNGNEKAEVQGAESLSPDGGSAAAGAAGFVIPAPACNDPGIRKEAPRRGGDPGIERKADGGGR
ncbi:hypothetical protein KKF61_07645 [Patescibacteria group bacterium]|nr:hypothetical protein [Patescibacteria group bacterium]